MACDRFHSQSGAGLYQDVMNKMFKGHLLSDGEIHPPVKTKNGWVLPSYLGPGSLFEKKLKAGVQPVSEVDRVARAHDGRYALAKTRADIREADKKMVAKLNEISKRKGDHRFNIAVAKYPIKAKMWLEDRGIVKPESFAELGGVEDRPYVEDFVAKETMAGYGKAGKGGKKRSKWMKHVARVRAKNPGKSYKDVLKLASKSYER